MVSPAPAGRGAGGGASTSTFTEALKKQKQGSIDKTHKKNNIVQYTNKP